MNQCVATGRTMGGKMDGEPSVRIVKTFLGHPYNFGDDFASLLHKHLIAHMQLQRLQHISIVKGGPPYRGAGQQHGIHIGNRRDRPCAAHLKDHLTERGLSLFGLKLVGNGPGCAVGQTN